MVESTKFIPFFTLLAIVIAKNRTLASTSAPCRNNRDVSRLRRFWRSHRIETPSLAHGKLISGFPSFGTNKSMCSIRQLAYCAAFLSKSLIGSKVSDLKLRNFNSDNKIDINVSKGTNCNAKIPFACYRLYEYEKKNEDDEPDSKLVHRGSCQEIIPPITPRPLVMDQVEDWYPTQYRTFQFPFFQNGETNSESRVVTIRQTSFGCGKLGSNVWPAAVALSCHLVSSLFAKNDDTIKNDSMNRLRLLELGAGCGLPSCVCREFGLKRDNNQRLTCQVIDQVIATDFWEDQSPTMALEKSVDSTRLLPTYLFGENLKFNLLKSAGIGDNEKDSRKENGNDNNHRCKVQKLDWHDEFHVFKAKLEFDPNLVIASDIVYYVEDVLHSVRALEILLETSNVNDGSNPNITRKQRKQALIFSPLDMDRKGLPLFRKKIKEMVDSRDGWSLVEKQLELRVLDHSMVSEDASTDCDSSPDPFDSSQDEDDGAKIIETNRFLITSIVNC